MNVPKVNFKISKHTLKSLSRCISSGLVESCHDCSEGGLSVALAEMAFSGNLGMEIFLPQVKHKISNKNLRDDIILFSESNSRFIVEVAKENQGLFEKMLNGTNFSVIGRLTDTDNFTVYGLNKKQIISIPIQVLKEAWQKPLRW